MMLTSGCSAAVVAAHTLFTAAGTSQRCAARREGDASAPSSAASRSRTEPSSATCAARSGAAMPAALNLSPQHCKGNFSVSNLSRNLCRLWHRIQRKCALQVLHILDSVYEKIGGELAAADILVALAGGGHKRASPRQVRRSAQRRVAFHSQRCVQDEW